MKDKICLKLINFPFTNQKVEKYSKGLGAGGSVLPGLKSTKRGLPWDIQDKLS